ADGVGRDEGQRPRRGARPQLPRLRKEPRETDGRCGRGAPVRGDVPPRQYLDAAGTVAEVGRVEGAGGGRYGGERDAFAAVSRPLEVGVSPRAGYSSAFTGAARCFSNSSARIMASASSRMGRRRRRLSLRSFRYASSSVTPYLCCMIPLARSTTLRI